MGDQVRSADRGEPASPPDTADRPMAFRRDGRADRRPAHVSLARGRRRGRGPRRPGPKARQQARGAEVAEATAQEPGHPPRDHHDRQARILPARSSRSWAYEPPPTRRDAGKQPRRKLPPGHPTTRTEVAEVQVSGLSHKVPLQPRRRLQHLQYPAASDLAIRTSTPASAGQRSVGGRHRGRMIEEEGEGPLLALPGELVSTAAPDCVAVRVGFEPTLGFHLNTLSKRAPSTTRPPHLNARGGGPPGGRRVI